MYVFRAENKRILVRVSMTVMKHHDQRNSEKKGFILAHSSTSQSRKLGQEPEALSWRQKLKQRP